MGILFNRHSLGLLYAEVILSDQEGRYIAPIYNDIGLNSGDKSYLYFENEVEPNQL
jgi:hypothetical protein